MTSIPRRNGTLGPTLASLEAQSRPPDEIRLYVGLGCHVAQLDVTCVTVEDLGPITKLSAVVDPAVPDDAIIVTVDDDIIYEPRWLETLVDAAEKMPDCAVGRAGWNATDFLTRPLSSLSHYIWAAGDTCDVVEGWAGVAYRKRFFDDDIMRPPPEFQLVDDVWISGYLFKRGIARRLITPRMADERAGNLPGLHNRVDFLKLNYRAAILAFS